MTSMSVVKRHVVDNTVVREAAVPGGSAVAAVLHEPARGDDFLLTEELRGELREASASATRGECVDMDAVLAELSALQ